MNFEELKNNKLNLNQALKIAKEILKEEEGNFIHGLKESSTDRHLPYTAGQIAKELTSSQTGRYKEKEKNIAVSLGHWGKENLGTMKTCWTEP